MQKRKNNLEAHYPCGVTLSLEQRYKLQEYQDESGAIQYQIIDTTDMKIEESHYDKDEANEALKYYNTEDKL